MSRSDSQQGCRCIEEKAMEAEVGPVLGDIQTSFVVWIQR